ncbi:MAG: glycoside hydrolase family 36 protein [Clostridia bacterium]
MKESKLFIKYRTGGKVYTDDLYQTQHYFIENDCQGDRLKVKIIPREKLELIAFELQYGREFAQEDRFFANGYQSWTTSREYQKQDKYKGLSPLTKIVPLAKQLAATTGDYLFCPYPQKSGIFRSYTYTYIRREEEVELWGSLSERQGFTIFSADMNQGLFTIAKDVEGLTIDSPYELLDLVKLTGVYDGVFDSYFKTMGVAAPRIEHLSGYTSWYNYFQKIDESIILRDLNGLDRAKDHSSIFQIDDGYAPFVGDWLDKNPTDFPNGMRPLAQKIHDKGYLAGIWLAPFNVQRASRTAREHPDWLIKKKNGKPLLGCAGWGGAYTLDIYHPEARAHMKKFFDVILNDWGYDLVKLDFLYSQCMQPRNNKTRGTIMCEAMEFLRECVGDKLILGCGVPLGATFGYADACRISCDVDLTYKDKIYNKLHINREVPSTQNAMTNSIFRRHLNGRVFCNDPDVFFLRDFNLKFTKEQKLLLAKINNLFGNVLFVSDDIGRYKDEELEILKKAFKKSNAIIISAEFVASDTISIVYLEDGEKKKLTFDLPTGESNLEW